MNYVQLDPELGMAKLQAIVDLYGRAQNGEGSGEQYLILSKRRLAQLREEIKKRTDNQLRLLENRLPMPTLCGQATPSGPTRCTEP